MPSLRHVHKYMKAGGKSGKRGIYMCKHAECMHNIHKDLLIGRLSICNVCGSEFVLDQIALKLKHPHCVKCTKGKRGEKAKREEMAIELILNQ